MRNYLAEAVIVLTACEVRRVNKQSLYLLPARFIKASSNVSFIPEFRIPFRMATFGTPSLSDGDESAQSMEGANFENLARDRVA